MIQAIRFFVFVAIVSLAVILNLVDFWGLVGMATLVLILLIALTIRYPAWTRSAMGYAGFQIGNNNNFPLYILIALTVITYVFAFKYGAGEPLFVSAWRDSVAIVSPYYSEDRQSEKNRALYGVAKSDDQMERERDYLTRGLRVNFTQYEPKQSDEVREQCQRAGIQNWQADYNQRLHNWGMYNLFVSDGQMRAFLAAMPPNWQIQAAVAGEEPPIRRTWLFWRLAFLFTFLTLLCLPFSLSDEVAAGFKAAADYLRRKQKEFKSGYKTQPTPVPIAAPGGQAPAPAAAQTAKGTAYRWSALFASDMAAEFVIRLLEGLGRFFGRI